MKNKLFRVAVLSFTGFLANAQIGINTTSPRATLDVVGFPADKSKLDGIIAPRLTGDELRAKSYTANQTGAMVYVTAADSAPAAQTINVNAAGYYYFDGTAWVKQAGSATGTLALDWHLTGNTDAEISAPAQTLGNAPVANTNYLGTRGADNLILVTNSAVSGVLDTNGTLQGGNSNTVDNFSSITWGSNNTLSNRTSSNVALGRSNTVAAQTANFPGVAIGANNSALSGAKVTGNNNFATGANTVVLGNNNGTSTTNVSGINVGNSNVNGGGFAVGTGNTVTTNNYVFGNANTASGPANAIGFGIRANAVIANQTVYANTAHTFSGQGVIGTDLTDVGINMTPSSINDADLEVRRGISIAGTASAANAACTSANEGAIRYNSTTHAHEGCNGTNWKALY